MVQSKGVIKAVAGSSFLLTLVFIMLFLYFNATGLYAENSARWIQILGTYLIAFSLVLVVGVIINLRLVTDLGKANYWKTFALRFIPSAIVSLAILYFFRILVKGTGGINPLQAIEYVPISILLFHLFVVSQIEEIMFRGILFESIRQKSSLNIAYLITAIAFSLFHYSTSGGSFLVMATYFPLSYAWTYIKLNGYPLLSRASPKLFGATPLTQQANAGSHFAWNLFILGFIRPGI